MNIPKQALRKPHAICFAFAHFEFATVALNVATFDCHHRASFA